MSLQNTVIRNIILHLNIEECEEIKKLCKEQISEIKREEKNKIKVQILDEITSLYPDFDPLYLKSLEFDIRDEDITIEYKNIEYCISMHDSYFSMWVSPSSDNEYIEYGYLFSTKGKKIFEIYKQTECIEEKITLEEFYRDKNSFDLFNVCLEREKVLKILKNEKINQK